MTQQRGYRLFCKRLLDVTIAGIALVLLAPVMAATAILIRVTMGAPVLFRHLRPGFKGQLFTLYKFRTMRAANSAADHDVKRDADRLTVVGRFLRRWSIDELPQLFNVLRGELSLVGPRPLLPQYLERYSPRQARRHDVLPGMTGWAQVNGRNAVDWDERFELDLWYVEHWSLLLDGRILARTIFQLLRRSEVAHPGHVTMPEFLGPEQGRRVR